MSVSRRWFIGGLVSAAVLASADVTAGAVLKAGFARNDITPPHILQTSR